MLPESFKSQSTRCWKPVGTRSVISTRHWGMLMPKRSGLGASIISWAPTGGMDVRRRRRLRLILPPRHRGAEEVGGPSRRTRLGIDHGAHRAGCRLRCGRRPNQSCPTGHGSCTSTASSGITPGDSGDLSEHFHLCWLARRAVPAPRASRTSRPSSVRRRNRRTRRAQWRVCHQRRTQDGASKGLGDPELAFGQHGVPAVGWLVGEAHNGIRRRCSRSLSRPA